MPAFPQKSHCCTAGVLQALGWGAAYIKTGAPRKLYQSVYGIAVRPDTMCAAAVTTPWIRLLLWPILWSGNSLWEVYWGAFGWGGDILSDCACIPMSCCLEVAFHQPTTPAALGQLHPPLCLRFKQLWFQLVWWQVAEKSSWKRWDVDIGVHFRLALWVQFNVRMAKKKGKEALGRPCKVVAA